MVKAGQGDVRQPVLGSRKGRLVPPLLGIFRSLSLGWAKGTVPTNQEILKVAALVSEASGHNNSVWWHVFWKLQAGWLSRLSPCTVSHLLKLLKSIYHEVSVSHFCGLLVIRKFCPVNSLSSSDILLVIHECFP